jgi:hypothetical protein
MPTYKLISSYTAGVGGTASISFTSIPSTYTDLVVYLSVKTDYSTSARDYAPARFNSVSSGYSRFWMFGHDSNSALQVSSASSQSYLGNSPVVGDSSVDNIFSSSELYIPDYLGSQSKVVHSYSMSPSNSTGTWMASASYMMSNLTGSINSFTIFPGGGNANATTGVFEENSTAYLYGISNA